MKKKNNNILSGVILICVLLILPIFLIYIIFKKIGEALKNSNLKQNVIHSNLITKPYISTNNSLKNQNIIRNNSRIMAHSQVNQTTSDASSNLNHFIKNISSGDDKMDGIEYDPILPKALLDFIKTGDASISYIQQRYAVGYARAARIVDQMEQNGFISPANTINKRKVLINEQQYYKIFSNGYEDEDEQSFHINQRNTNRQSSSEMLYNNKIYNIRSISQPILQQLSEEEINNINKNFLEIIDAYVAVKENEKIIKYVRSLLKRNNFYLNNRFNFLFNIDNDFVEKLNLYANQTKQNNEILENNLIIKYLIKLCQAKEKYFNRLFFNNSYLNSLNFLTDKEYELPETLKVFLLSLVESEFITDTFSQKFAVFYLMFEERNKLLSNDFEKNYIDKYNLVENQDINYYAKEIISKNMNILDEEIIMYYDGYHNNRTGDILLEEADLFEYANLFKDIREKQERKNFLKELETGGLEEEQVTKINLDIMSALEFEDFVAQLFKKLGYNASRTKRTGDQGADVIAEKDGEKIVIQVKHFLSSVGNRAIQEVVSSKKYYNAQKCMVVTNSTFTKSAKELAKANNVVLWDGDALLQKIKEI